MVTSSTDELDLVHALESGADDCLARPFGAPELRAGLFVANRILALQNELIQAREELRSQAMRDGLTGLWNRTAFLDLFKHELQRARRINGSTGLLLIDLDHFKRVNDTYGHLAGDIVLKETALRLRQTVRSYDFVGRYGGEEFLIALPGTGEKQLRQRAEAIRSAICGEAIHTPQGDIPISISIGVAIAERGEQSATSLLALADVGLYRAKDLGRNRSVICEKPSSAFLDSTQTHRKLCLQCEAGETNCCAISAV
jgi:diguanylate cyclase (GGDEF)-like protein